MIIPDLTNICRNESSIKKNYPEFYQYINDNYPEDITFQEKLYWFHNGINDYPICRVCGSRVNFKNFSKGYYNTCSLRCRNLDPETIAKKNQTMISNYGTIEESYKQRREKANNTLIQKYGSLEKSYKQRIEKTKQTNLDRYGVEYIMQDEEFYKKSKQTIISKYGSLDESYKQRIEKTKNTLIMKYGSIENAYEEIQEKSKRTNLDIYGVDNISKLKQTKDKVKETCLKNHGVSYGFLLEKTKQSMLDKYGVEYAQQNKIIANKSKSTKKQQIIDNHEDIIDIIDGFYLCKCPHIDCDKCESKIYKCSPITYHNRKYNGYEQCTNLLPELPSKSKDTSLELFIKNILDNHGIQYESNNRTILDGKELDIYIPSKQMAIECNGIYWHSTYNGKSKKYHIDKYIKCKEKGIQLITIWEDQIINKFEIVKSIILSKLGIYGTRIYARKCIIKEIGTNELKDFLNKYHLQGNINSSIRLGLYYNNELASVMSFGKKRKPLNSNGNGYELYRFCNKFGIQVIGGASKLLNYFIKKYNPSEIISFASNDISNGNLYNQLNFNEISQTNSYWYINKKTLNRYHRYNFTRDKLTGMGYDKGTNMDIIMDNLGYFKIYDSGQTKYVLNLKQLEI